MKNKIILSTMLGLSLFAAGCEKNYSVEDFQKDEALRTEWLSKCGIGGESTNCQNVRLADHQLDLKELQELADEVAKMPIDAVRHLNNVKH